MAEPFTDSDKQKCFDGIKKIEEAWNNPRGEVPINFRYEFSGRVSRRHNCTDSKVCSSFINF